MGDFVITKDLDNDGDVYGGEEMHNLVIFESVDPATYKRATKQDKWRKIMNNEMSAIGKNNT